MKHLPLLDRYDALVAQGALARDGAQVAAIERLEALAGSLGRRAAPAEGLLGRALSLLGHRPAAAPAARGLYLWGSVGRGKTTLMDLFFDGLEARRKRRAHFHAFMADVHERLHRARRAADSGADPVTRVAAELAVETRILCFDEFCVTDIADATILARLFSALFAAGVVVVATSNAEPKRLYEGGRNRDLFLPFIALLEERMQIIHLDARADYRMTREQLDETFFTPADAHARAALDALFLRLSGQVRGEAAAIEIKRRKIEVPQAARGVARFSFGEICGRPLGAADYMALAKEYSAIIVENVPLLEEERRNEARRFITLVDVLYEAKTLLAISTDAPVEQLCRTEHGNEAREFARAASRLTEMRSRDWLEECAARSGAILKD